MSTNDNFGVFEVGMSKPGEILKLSALVRPHIATITKYIGGSFENFQNINGIAKAKSEIIYNIEKGGSVILNKDDKFFDYFKKIAEKKHIKVVSFGYSKKSDVTYDSLKNSQGGYILKVFLVNKKQIILKVSSNNKKLYNEYLMLYRNFESIKS